MYIINLIYLVVLSFKSWASILHKNLYELISYLVLDKMSLIKILLELKNILIFI